LRSHAICAGVRLLMTIVSVPFLCHGQIDSQLSC
jgi:hypothetical protein